MQNHLKVVGIALLIGIIAFIAFFLVGSFANSGKLGIATFCLVGLAGGFWIGRRHQKSVLYAGAVINLPTWLILAGPADPGQFQHYLYGLLIGLVCTYAGSLIGSRFSKPSEVADMRP